MKLLGEFLVGMGLDGQGFGDGEDLEEERQLLSIAGNRGLREKGLIVVDEVKEGPTSAKVFGRVGGVGAHP